MDKPAQLIPASQEKDRNRNSIYLDYDLSVTQDCKSNPNSFTYSFQIKFPVTKGKSVTLLLSGKDFILPGKRLKGIPKPKPNFVREFVDGKYYYITIDVTKKPSLLQRLNQEPSSASVALYLVSGTIQGYFIEITVKVKGGI